jgi:hypothetical protein
MRGIKHHVDFCVVGGGMAGVCAALSAARHGVKVALMQDRPVLGGNASSEIRMWICGARGKNNRETGILEELVLENLYRNNPPNYHIWDSVLYEKVKENENIFLLLNCSCLDAEMEGNVIKSVTGWQTTTQTKHQIFAKYFADCSGDSILAPLTNAEYRVGRESRDEFGESIQPESPDRKTMGHSILLQIRETNTKSTFIPPKFAYKFDEDDLQYRNHQIGSNFWWIELGGEDDTIYDTESIRDELLKIAFGVWDHMKNHGNHGVDNYVLDWIGFLPGKRESRRYVGDYIMTQNDIEKEGRFHDIVAYGGWSMDDHPPGGFRHKGKPTTHHPAPTPYGIPYRVLYSKNIENLFFAGRNISVTHAALSSTRVMGTCSVLGQAVGTAASICIKNNLTPRGIYESKIKELQKLLMFDDCYLPFMKREVTPLAKEAVLDEKYENIRNGYDRPIEDEDNGVYLNLGESIEFSYDQYVKTKGLRIVFDSNLNRKNHNMPCYYPLEIADFHVPNTLVKEFIVTADTPEGTKVVHKEENNYQRLVFLEFNETVKSISITLVSTWGEERAHIFSIDVL